MVKKEITFYELMGLIKDSQAPKKIVYDNEIFIWNGSSYWSKFQEKNLMVYISTISDFDIPHLIIEILSEENNEWEDIEELSCDYVVPNTPATEDEAYIMSCLFAHEQFINKLIKNQKYLKERLDEDELK